MHALTAFTIGLPGKLRNGDCHTHFELPDEGLVVAAVADGVGSHPCDWAASAAACAAIHPAFTTMLRGETLEARLARAAGAAHDAVQSLRGEAKGALSTLVLVAWQPREGRCHFVNVGDSRLYRVDGGAPEPLTIDDTQNVVRKGDDGQVIQQSGVVATARGLTRALGDGGSLEFTVQATQVGPGTMLALVTDGCHELPGFAHRLREVQHYLDLAEAAQRLLGSLCHEQGHDDATAILMRDTSCPPSVREAALLALATGKGLTHSGICGHLLIAAVVDEMVRGAGASDTVAVLRGLDALVDAGLRPRRQDALRVIKAFIDDGRPETLRAYRRLVDWAGKL